MCISVVLTALTIAYGSPSSNHPLWRLDPGDIVCLVEVRPGRHPAGVHWTTDGEAHGGYIDSISLVKKANPDAHLSRDVPGHLTPDVSPDKIACKPTRIGDMIFSCEAPRGNVCTIVKHPHHGPLLPQWRNGGGMAGTGLCWASGHDPRYGESPCAIDIGNHPDDPNFGHEERCSK